MTYISFEIKNTLQLSMKSSFEQLNFKLLMLVNCCEP